MRSLAAVTFAVLAMGCELLTPPPPRVASQVAFVSSVDITPPQAQPGRRVTFTIELANVGNVEVLGDLELSVVSKGVRIYQQTWPQMAFTPNAVWNLTQGFSPATNAETEPYLVGLKVRDARTGTVLLDDPQVTTLVVAR